MFLSPLSVRNCLCFTVFFILRIPFDQDGGTHYGMLQCSYETLLIPVQPRHLHQLVLVEERSNPQPAEIFAKNRSRAVCFVGSCHPYPGPDELCRYHAGTSRCRGLSSSRHCSQRHRLGIPRAIRQPAGRSSPMTTFPHPLQQYFFRSILLSSPRFAFALHRFAEVYIYLRFTLYKCLLSINYGDTSILI